MKRYIHACSVAILLLAGSSAFADTPPGAGTASKAHVFSLPDTDGNLHSLTDYAGKIVVLEWTNPNCPFVKRHYEKGAMQRLQKAYTDKGVIWLTVNSTNPEHQDYLSNEQLRDTFTSWEAASTAALIDRDGSVGREYGAKTTPHIFIIDGEMNLAYAGAVDDDPRGKKEPSDRVVYVRTALDNLLEGKAVEPSSTQPYGCSIKYGN